MSHQVYPIDGVKHGGLRIKGNAPIIGELRNRKTIYTKTRKNPRISKISHDGYVMTRCEDKWEKSLMEKDAMKVNYLYLI